MIKNDGGSKSIFMIFSILLIFDQFSRYQNITNIEIYQCFEIYGIKYSLFKIFGAYFDILGSLVFVFHLCENTLKNFRKNSWKSVFFRYNIARDIFFALILLFHHFASNFNTKYYEIDFFKF